MSTEILNRRFLLFLLKILIAAVLVLAFIAVFNSSVDASHVITSKNHDRMAELALEGNIVAVPENYNERVYQLAIVNHMPSMPETVASSLEVPVRNSHRLWVAM